MHLQLLPFPMEETLSDENNPAEMSWEARMLLRDHRELDHKIIEAERRPCHNEAQITQWKHEKLRIREQLDRLGISTNASAQYGKRPPKAVTRPQREARRLGLRTV
ncbi:MAG: DUF465 domain-containing protein [Proteobacteria bacterium]|nr:DUF465 domain-containing protein [Pseudomonadota bacterium]NBX86815.1 DUF465 domain-containing protein [Pseudomonadota bacterium]